MSIRSSLYTLFLVVFMLVAFSVPVFAQDDEVTPTVAPVEQIPPIVDDSPPAVDPAPVDDVAAAFINLSILVAGLVESLKRVFIKAIATKQKWTDERYSRVVYALAVVCGVVAALLTGPSIDFFAIIGVNLLPPVFGIIASGIVISFGENFAHYALDSARSGVGILKSWGSSVSTTTMIGTTTPLPTYGTTLHSDTDGIEQRIIAALANEIKSAATTTATSVTTSRSSPEAVSAPPLGV